MRQDNDDVPNAPRCHLSLLLSQTIRPTKSASPWLSWFCVPSTQQAMLNRSMFRTLAIPSTAQDKPSTFPPSRPSITTLSSTTTRGRTQIKSPGHQPPKVSPGRQTELHQTNWNGISNQFQLRQDYTTTPTCHRTAYYNIPLRHLIACLQRCIEERTEQLVSSWLVQWINIAYRLSLTRYYSIIIAPDSNLILVQ